MIRDRNSDLEVTTATDRGTPYRVIDRYIEANGIDAVAMGNEGTNGPQTHRSRSVTENVPPDRQRSGARQPPAASDSRLREATVESVLFADGRERRRGGRRRLGNRTRGDLRRDGTRDLLGRYESVPDANVPRRGPVHLESSGEDALESVRERARERNVTLTGTVATGPLARVIPDYAAENEIDLAAMGTHGRSGMKRHFLGSVTENVVRNAELPVFCVPMGID